VKLALRELVRRPGRFVAATAILTLIASLLMLLGGLLDGLTAGSTGAYRAQRGSLIVYSATAQDSLVRSRITPAARRAVERAAGGTAGGLGSVQLGASIPGRGTRDIVPVVLFGYELAPRGLPRLAPAGRGVIADTSLRSEGVGLGTVVRLGPARTPVTVVGFASDIRFSGQGTLWGSLTTWRAVLSASRPSERAGSDVVQALVLAGALARPAAIDAATSGATHTLTVPQAIAVLPGLSQQQTVFDQIIWITVLIGVIVIALFFALITVERTPLYGVLKALGASSRTLFEGVLVQAVAVTAVASTLAIAASLALAAAIPPGSIPFVATAQRLATSTAYLLVAAVAGCVFSLRRILRIDPASAIGGEQ